MLCQPIRVRLFGIVLLMTLLLSSLLSLPGLSYAANPDYSNWMQNLSEDPVNPTNEEEYFLQIAMHGETVHVVWLAKTSDYTWHYVYRRSIDNGQSFEPRQILYDVDASSGDEYPYLAVSGSYVHVAIRHDNTVIYLRSSDAGATWDDPQFMTNHTDGWGLDRVMLRAHGSRVIIATGSSRRMLNGPYDSAVGLQVSDDNGTNWRAVPVAQSNEHSNWGFSDLLLTDTHVYVLYHYAAWNNGLAKGQVHLATFDTTLTNPTHTLISTPTDGDTHKALAEQDGHYAPKLAASGDNVYVVWLAEVAPDTWRVFFRRSIDGGATVADAISMYPDGWTESHQELVIAGGTYVYVIFVGQEGVMLRRSSDGGATFEPVQRVSAAPDTPLIEGGQWPEAFLDPVDPTGATVHIAWYPSASTWSTDGGATFWQLAMLDPVFSRWTGEIAPAMLLDETSTLHILFGHRYSGGAEPDVFYGRRLPPPPRTDTNQALHLTYDTQANYYDTMVVPASPDNDLHDALTLETWVRPAAAAEGKWDGTLINKRDAGSWYTGRYLLRLYYNRPMAVVRTATEQYDLRGATELPINAWSHMALTFDSSQTSDNCRLYVNGALVAATTVPEPLMSGDGMLVIGGEGGAFTGALDEVRLWNRARTQAEIQATMFGGLQGDETGLVSYYPLDGTPADESGHGNDGVLLYQEQFQPLFTDPAPEGAAQITPAQGGSLRVIDRGAEISLDVPAQAVATNATFNYIGLVPSVQPLPPAYTSVVAFELTAIDEGGQAIEQFAEPLSLRITYTDEQLAALGITDPATLGILYWNGQQWEPVSATVDTSQQQISAMLDHFSTFALAAGGSRATLYLPLIQR
jgi:hypothetical protein